MSHLILAGIKAAEAAHRGQRRKFTGEPYIVHPIEVAELVASVTNDQATIVAALLHDVVEDTHVTLDNIRESFGDEIAELVFWCTKKSVSRDGNRLIRKEIDRIHYSSGPKQSQTIKLADVISNTKDIHLKSLSFAKVYVLEQEALVNSLTAGHPKLFKMAKEVVSDAKSKLEEMKKCES